MTIHVSRRLTAVALAGVATLALAGAAAAAKGGDAAVTIKNFSFQPMAVTVPVGGSVTWKNLDGEPHTVTGLDGTFRSAALDENDSFSFRFAKAGVYKYVCTIHPKMTGTVTVQ
jgi:plastocyanin